MILTHLNVQHSGTKAIFARTHTCARTCRHSSSILIVYWQLSAPGWLGNGNQKPSPLRIRTTASDHGSYDQQAEAATPSQNLISIARSRLTTSLSCSSMRTASAVGARLHRSICAPRESNQSTRMLNRKCTSRCRFADVHTTDGRVEASATFIPSTFDSLCSVTRALSNALTGVLSNRVGGPT